ncbi:hypothetical protein PVNG_02599 [Plasmodium vivax North Korean]|uniref:Uncharacterized protein n=1 Tax=Plasmodium vivax North Korean TaxID=1035514 RepID=A0A0J9TYN3_PLAVI|nr:hypothetical protein PVNG_02599 [Plasmodium vivax North Korean]
MALLLHLLEYLLHKLGIRKHIKGVKRICMNSIKHFILEELELTPFTVSLLDGLARNAPGGKPHRESGTHGKVSSKGKRPREEKGAFGAYLAYLDSLKERRHQLSFDICYVGRVEVDWGVPSSGEGNLSGNRSGSRSGNRRGNRSGNRSGGVHDAHVYSGLTAQVENVFVSVKLQEEGVRSGESARGGRGKNGKKANMVGRTVGSAKNDGERSSGDDRCKSLETRRSLPLVALLLGVLYLNVVKTKLCKLACSLLQYITHNILKRNLLRLLKGTLSKMAKQHILCLDVRNVNIIFEDSLSNGKKRIFLSVHVSEIHADNCSFIRSREREGSHVREETLSRNLLQKGKKLIRNGGDTLQGNTYEDLFNVGISQVSVYQDGRSQHIGRSDIREDKLKYKFFFFYNMKVTHQRECLLKETNLLWVVSKDRGSQRYLLSVVTPGIQLALSNDGLYSLYLFLYNTEEEEPASPGKRNCSSWTFTWNSSK